MDLFIKEQQFAISGLFSMNYTKKASFSWKKDATKDAM